MLIHIAYADAESLRLSQRMRHPMLGLRVISNFESPNSCHSTLTYCYRSYDNLWSRLGFGNSSQRLHSVSFLSALQVVLYLAHNQYKSQNDVSNISE